jgi:RNA:NAD 2'-phosphotransferase (TPT1/KptA family)
MRAQTIRGTKATLDEIKLIVAEDDKQRFSLITRDNELYMRANQGKTRLIRMFRHSLFVHSFFFF